MSLSSRPGQQGRGELVRHRYHSGGSGAFPFNGQARSRRFSPTGQSGDTASLPGERQPDLQPVPVAKMRVDKQAVSPPGGDCANQLDLGPGHCGPPRRPQL